MKELAKIQRELKAPKGQTNKFGGYKYRSAEDILEALKPLLGECVLTITDNVMQVGERYYVQATATITNGGTSRSVTGWAREPEDKKGSDASQITGAASSYARKYALNGLFAIDDTKDADATNKHDSEPQKPASKPAPAKQPAQPKADPRAIVAKRIEANANPDGEPISWFEVVAWERGDNKGKTLGEVAMNGDVAAIKQLLDYIDPVALEHGEAVNRLKAAIAEAQSNADAKAKGVGDIPTATDPKTGKKVDAPF